MKRIVVTGGTGYIGSHTVVELLQEGYEVLIMDNLSNSRIEVLEGIRQITGKEPKFFEIDLCDDQAVAEFFFSQTPIDCVVHFAASKAVGESVEKPLMYYHNNLLSLIHLLEQMHVHSIPNMVFSSSCTVYGQPDSLPVTESTPFKPAQSPYGNTKQISEEILRDACHANDGLRVISLRYFNPVGAHPSALIGELPLGVPNNLVPFIAQTAAGLRKELLVFGDDYDTADGSAVRDYIHVVDLAKAHVSAVQRQLAQQQKHHYEYFNLGTGKGMSVFQVIHSFEKVNNLKVNYRVVERRPGDVEKIYADTSLANRELNWSALMGIDEMMRSTWKWQQRLMQENMHINK